MSALLMLFFWPLTHYGIYCEDHIIDVVTSVVSAVHKLSAGEIHAWGIV